MLPDFPDGPQFDWVTDMARSEPPNSTKLSDAAGPTDAELWWWRGRETQRVVRHATWFQPTERKPPTGPDQKPERLLLRASNLLLSCWLHSECDYQIAPGKNLGLVRLVSFLFFDHLHDACNYANCKLGSVRIHGICQPPTKPRRREGSGKTLQR